MSVAAPVLQYLPQFGDRRRFARLNRIVTALVQRTEATLPRALASLAATTGAYRFFANRALSAATILASARPDCVAKIAQEARVLLIQDTTLLDFTSHPATAGLGPTGTRRQRTQGFLVHTCLAASTAGTPLGLAAQQLWARDPAAAGQATQRRQRPLAEKESARWPAVEAASWAGMPAGVELVLVADAEADFFALFAAPRPAQAQLLLRVARPARRLADGRTLGETAAAAPVWGHYTVQLQARGTQPARTATCVLRVGPVTLRPPAAAPTGLPPQTRLPLTALWVEEEAPPAGSDPLHWLLLTTLPVRSFIDAATCVGYYSQRWLIEQYHYLLKTGCKAERLQLQHYERLARAVATCCLVAVRVLWLTYLAREQPEAPCTVVFTTDEWQALCCASAQTPHPPPAPPALREAVRLTAKLGGFLGRTGDGEPGPLTIWRGLARLADLTSMWQLLHPPPAVTQSDER